MFKLFSKKSSFSLTENQSIALLTATIIASLAIYYGMIVRQTPLVKYYNIPHYDLLAMLKTDPGAQNRLIIAFLLLAILYITGWWASRSLSHRRSIWLLVLGGMIAAGIILLYLYPFDAADIFDYISHGRILGIFAGNPFRQVTADYPGDPFFQFPAWPKTPTAYGPLWEYLAALTARLAGNGIFQNVLAFKLLTGLFVLVSVALTAVVMLKADARRALSSVWLLAMNPLVLYESFGHGHNDIVMVAWMIASVLAMQRRHYTLAVLALVAGGLVKYIPFLLVPVAGLVALYELPNSYERIRFLVITGLAAAILMVAGYARFWFGLDTLTVERRTQLLTTSLPSIIYSFLRLHITNKTASSLVSETAAGITVLFAFWQAERASRKQDAPAWQRFTRAGLNILLFYMFVTILWFHQWYMVWGIAFAVLLPPGPVWALTLFNGFAVLSKPFVMGPLLFMRMPTQPHEWLELRLSVGVLALPWLASILTLWIIHRREQRKNISTAIQTEPKLPERQPSSST